MLKLRKRISTVRSRKRDGDPELRKKNSVEIVTIGNELLIGHTLDTNSNWIAQRLREHGWLLRRITTIPDSLNEIATAVEESLRRKPRLLFTLGGLGPTPDDMTLKGIARALGTPVRLNETALEMVRQFYEQVPLGPLTDTSRP